MYIRKGSESMSYIKFIDAAATPIPSAWRGNADQAYRSLTDIERAYFIFDQVLILRYLYLAYGGAIPVLINNYSKETWERVRGLILQKETYEKGDDRTRAEKASFITLVSIIAKIAGGWAIGNTNEVIDWVHRNARCTGNYPKVVKDIPECLAFYDTFIKYLNPTIRNNSLTTNESVSLPTLSLVGQSLVVCYDAVFSKYSLDKKLHNVLINSQITSNSFFEFVSGFNLNDKTKQGFTNLIGILISYSLDLDTSWLYVNYTDTPQVLDNPRSKFGLMEDVRHTSNESKIFNFLRRAVVRFEPFLQTPFDALETRSETSFRRLFISFLIALRRHYNLVFDDYAISILSAVMGEGEQGLQTYFNSSTKDVSTESIKEFEGSVFSEFPELRIGNRVVSEDTLDNLGVPCKDIATLKENLKAMRAHDAAITGPAPLKDAAGDVDSSGTKSAAGKELDQALDSMPTDDSTESGGAAEEDPDQGNESGDVGATGDDDTPGTKSDNDEEASTDKNDEDNTDESDTSKKDDKRDKISMHPVPDIPDVSDKEGVKLELTSSETTDTVFYRVELKTYIDSILNNPPKTISQQKIQVLKKIEAYWLNILTPQCLFDLINTVIKLPSEFEIHKGKQ